MDSPDQGLAVLTMPSTAQQSNHQRGHRYNLLTHWARQGALQLFRWLPVQQRIFVGESSFVVNELAHAITQRATTHKLDAVLFTPPA